jgi:hypothetical protein
MITLVEAVSVLAVYLAFLIIKGKGYRCEGRSSPCQPITAELIGYPLFWGFGRGLRTKERVVHPTRQEATLILDGYVTRQRKVLRGSRYYALPTPHPLDAGLFATLQKASSNVVDDCTFWRPMSASVIDIFSRPGYKRVRQPTSRVPSGRLVLSY